MTAGSLAMIGCGPVTGVHAGATLAVAVSEYRVTPQDVRAPAGTLTIVVHNVGRLTHHLVLTQGGRTDASTEPIPPGHSASLIAYLTPGRYRLASTLFDDQALGAYGTLRVG